MSFEWSSEMPSLHCRDIELHIIAKYMQNVSIGSELELSLVRRWLLQPRNLFMEVLFAPFDYILQGPGI